MKKAFRVSGILVTAVACASTGLIFTGCGEQPGPDVTVDSLFNATMEKYKQTNIIEDDYKINFDVAIKESGVTTDFKLNGDYKLNIDYNSKVMYLDGTMNEELMGITATQNQQMYCAKENNNFSIYKRLKSTSTFTDKADSDWSEWTFNTVTSAQGIENIVLADNMYDEIKQYADNLTLQKNTANINGYECYVVKGSLTGEKIKDLMKDDVKDLDLSKFEIQFTFYFDKSNSVLYSVEIDFGEGMRHMIEKEVSDSGLIGENAQLEINDSKLTVTTTSLTSDKTISVPEDVKKNAKEDQELKALFTDLEY